MIVAGGCYVERCTLPAWDQRFGSGGRAAAAVGDLSPGTELHTFCPPGNEQKVQAVMGVFGIGVTATPSSEMVEFTYFHPLSIPEIHPAPAHIQRATPLRVKGDVVLRFSFMEGEAIVEAKTAVYDPQSGGVRESFRANGSTADTLAIVLNESELRSMANEEDLDVAAATLIASEGADVIVAKRGTKGATVYEAGGGRAEVPAYFSDAVFKIGSGDVFSGAFTHFWAEAGKSPAEAADLASRAVALYCGTRALPIPPDPAALASLTPLRTGTAGIIYIAAPFFTIGQRWLVEEARASLLALGADVFSPLHEVGTGAPDDVIATADIAGLERCTAVLALLDGGDPGSLVEVGWARARNIPVVVLAEAVRPSDLTMPRGLGCEVVDDFATALYRAVWVSVR